MFDQPDRLIAEIADKAGERRRQAGIVIRPAFGDEAAQRIERAAFDRQERLPVGRPGPVDFGAVALRRNIRSGARPIRL